MIRLPKSEIFEAAVVGEKIGLRDRVSLEAFRWFFRRKLAQVFGDEKRKEYFAELYQILKSISDPRSLDDSVWGAVSLAGGTAIPTGHAANCITDSERSTKFMRGLREAIDQMRTSTGRRVEVLYAGTGPFASLALPTMATRKPNDVRFDLLDIHPESGDNLRRILSLVGFSDHVGRIITADATDFDFGKAQYDIVMMEVMGPGLSYEPQLAVMAATKKALRPGGMMLPERVDLGLVLARDEDFIEGDFTWSYVAAERDDCPEMIEVEMDLQDVDPGSYPVGVKTRVTVFGSNVVEPDQAIITRTTQIGECDVEQGATRLFASYPPGADLVYRTYEPSVRVE